MWYEADLDKLMTRTCLRPIPTGKLNRNHALVFGILLTNLNIYPVNIYFHGLGVIGWTIAGFVSKDKAILTNFGLQIPLFLIGIYKIII